MLTLRSVWAYRRTSCRTRCRTRRDCHACAAAAASQPTRREQRGICRVQSKRVAALRRRSARLDAGARDAVSRQHTVEYSIQVEYSRKNTLFDTARRDVEGASDGIRRSEREAHVLLAGAVQSRVQRSSSRLKYSRNTI